MNKPSLNFTAVKAHQLLTWPRSYIVKKYHHSISTRSCQIMTKSSKKLESGVADFLELSWTLLRGLLGWLALVAICPHVRPFILLGSSAIFVMIYKKFMLTLLVKEIQHNCDSQLALFSPNCSTHSSNYRFLLSPNKIAVTKKSRNY